MVLDLKKQFLEDYFNNIPRLEYISLTKIKQITGAKEQDIITVAKKRGLYLEKIRTERYIFKK